MALNRDILAVAINGRMSAFNDKTNDELITAFGSVASARLEMWRAISDEIIDHLKNYADLTVPGTGLIAPSGGGPVTGSSISGEIS